MTTPSVRSGPPEKQAPPAPDRMALVAEWTTPENENVELWVDYGLGDGRIIVIGGGRVATAAMINRIDVTEGEVVWLDSFATRPRTWRNAQAGIARARLAEARP